MTFVDQTFVLLENLTFHCSSESIWSPQAQDSPARKGHWHLWHGFAGKIETVLVYITPKNYNHILLRLTMATVNKKEVSDDKNHADTDTHELGGKKLWKKGNGWSWSLIVLSLVTMVWPRWWWWWWCQWWLNLALDNNGDDEWWWWWLNLDLDDDNDDNLAICSQVEDFIRLRALLALEGTFSKDGGFKKVPWWWQWWRLWWWW